MTYQLGWVFTDEGGKIEWSLVSTANSGAYVANPVSGSPVIGDGAWHHVLGVVDRGQQTASVYVDGTLAGSWSIAGLGTLDYGNAVTIGQDPTGSYGTATFDLDDLGIWRRALTSYEAASVYGAAQNSGESFDVYGPVKVGVDYFGTNINVNWQAGTLLQFDQRFRPIFACPRRDRAALSNDRYRGREILPCPAVAAEACLAGKTPRGGEFRDSPPLFFQAVDGA